MNERLKILRKTLKMNQQEFSERIGISQSALTLMENGKRTIRDVYIAQMCHAFNVNEVWLRTGDGEMFITLEIFSLDEQAKKNNLTEMEIAIMRSYMNLDRDIREVLMSELETIFKPANNETVATVDEEIEAELANYRQQLEAEKKGQILSALQDPKQEELG